MDYITWLKKHDNVDRYVLLLLSLDFSISETAKMIGMSRQNIYGVIKRNKDIVEEYIESVRPIIEDL